MSKESFIGGDYIETTGGSSKTFAKGSIELIGSQVINNGKTNGVWLGTNDPVPTVEKTDGTIQGFWLNVKENEIETAILGEEVKIKLFLDYAVSTNLTLVIKAKNDTEQIHYTKDEKPIEIPVIVPENKEFITETIHLNPHHFYKKNQETKFLFYIKESVIYESKPLIFKGFGKPDLFKKDKLRSYMFKKLENGSSVGYVSGERLDILTYQQWFENESKELDINKKDQIENYFISVYGIRAYGWSPKGEFGSEKNRKNLISYFENFSLTLKVAPSVLYTYAVGEGLLYMSKNIGNNFEEPINSFQSLGLDFFGHADSLTELYNGGYLKRSTFFSGGIAKTGMDAVLYPFSVRSNYAKTGNYMDIREVDGSVCVRNEGGGPTKIYPVWFRNMKNAIQGCTAVYARAYNLAKNNAASLRWSSLSANENFYFGYFKIQYPNRPLDYKDYGYKESNFLKRVSSHAVADKAYARWVTWRYILLTKYFSS